MPGMDGYEVAEFARQHPETSQVPIIFLTAKHDTEDDVLRGYDTGAVDFLFKPINPVILRSKIRVFLELFQNKKKISDAYRELQATQSQLVQSAKMASLGELVAGVAHEINNPLAFVKSHLSTVQRALGSIESDVEAALSEGSRANWQKSRLRLSEMEGGVARISDLVIKLRTFSRLDEGEIKRASVRDCVDSVLTILHHKLGERVRVEVELDGPDSIECYPGLLNQALMNLVSNGADAIQGQGTIRVSSSREGGLFRLSVRDTGVGIPTSLRDRVLEPFFTTKPVGQGTGLGLSITYSIAKKHGGDLVIDDAPNGGTIFSIVFPLALGERA
jgi:two-component system NtrC family sensor kinase